MIKKYENTDPDIPKLDVTLALVPESYRRTRHKTGGWSLTVIHGGRMDVPDFDYHVRRRAGRKQPARFTPDLMIFRRKTGKLLALALLCSDDADFRSDRQMTRYLSFDVPVFVSNDFGPMDKLLTAVVTHYRGDRKTSKTKRQWKHPRLGRVTPEDLRKITRLTK